MFGYVCTYMQMYVCVEYVRTYIELEVTRDASDHVLTPSTSSDCSVMTIWMGMYVSVH